MKKACLLLICLIISALWLVSCVPPEANGGNNGGDDPADCKHHWSDWTATIDSDKHTPCQDKRYERSCSFCGEREERVGSDADHSNVEMTVEPTCRSEGHIITHCTKCGLAKVTEILPKAGHSLIDGYDSTGHWLECTECDYRGDMQEHSWNDENICTKCGYEYHDHKWQLSLSFPANCINQGSARYYCTICDETKEETLPATGKHTAEDYEQSAESHYQICSVCGGEFNSTPHSYTDGQCSICGAYEEYYELSMRIPSVSLIPLFEEQIKRFADENKISIYLTIPSINFDMAGSDIVNDPTIASDIICYPQNTLEWLVDAGALMPLSDSAEAEIRDTLSPAAIRCAQFGDSLYAFPLALNDNTSVMYYDKSLISEEDAKSLEKIIAICEENNRLIRFDMESGWGMEHFFMALGCESRWSVDTNWSFTLESDNYNSPEGLIALRGMKPLIDSQMLNNSTLIHESHLPTGVIISNLSARQRAEKTFGKNLGVAVLPSFTVDGESYRLGAYCNSFLVGMKPTDDEKRADLITRLCLWLSGEECQMERFERLYWCPTNIAAQMSENVQADPYMPAQIEQSHTALPKMHEPGDYYHIINALYYDAQAARSTKELQEALDKYSEKLTALIGKE